MLQDLLIVPPQPVDALDKERVSLPQLAEQALVFRAVEILPALLVDVKPLPGDPRLLHGIELPLLILTLSRHPNISIFHAFRLLLFHRPNSDRCGRERPA